MLSRVWLCDPMACCPPVSPVPGILQAKILEWVAILFSRRSFQPRDWTQVSCIASRFLTIWATRKVQYLKKVSAYFLFPWIILYMFHTLVSFLSRLQKLGSRLWSPYLGFASFLLIVSSWLLTVYSDTPKILFCIIHCRVILHLKTMSKIYLLTSST